MNSTIDDRAVGNTPTAPRSKRHTVTSSVATTTTRKSNPISSNTRVVGQVVDLPSRHYVTEYNLCLMISIHNIGSGVEAQI